MSWSLDIYWVKFCMTKENSFLVVFLITRFTSFNHYKFFNSLSLRRIVASITGLFYFHILPFISSIFPKRFQNLELSLAIIGKRLFFVFVIQSCQSCQSLSGVRNEPEISFSFVKYKLQTVSRRSPWKHYDFATHSLVCSGF